MLSVQGLSVSFRTRAGWVSAVESVSFELPTGQTLGIVGESGSGKSVSSLAIMRLLPTPPAKISSGEIWFDSPSLGPVNLLTLPEKSMQHLRGNEIAMISKSP